MRSRRSNERFNRGRIATASAVPVPRAITSGTLVSWWTATNITDTGNGTAASAMADMGPAGATLTEGGAGLGPLRRDATGRRAKSVQFSSGKYNRTTNAAVVAVENGAASAWTLVRAVQPTLAGTSYYESWGHTSLTTRYAGERRENNQYRDQFVERDTVNNNNVGGLSASPIDHLTPQVQIFRMSVGSLQRRIDGVNQAAQPITRGTQNVDQFGLGALLTGAAPSLLSGNLLTNYLIYTGAISDADCALLETYFATAVGKPGIGVSWKSGYSTAASFGNGSNAWLILASIGQSNLPGRGTTPGPSVSASDHIYCLYPDGNLDIATDPVTDPTNAVGGTAVDSGPGVGMMIRAAQRLRELGETRNIMIVCCGIGGTDSAAWTSSLTTSPPIVNSPIGAAKHRIAEALKAPNAELVLAGYQGESDTLVSAVNWGTNWDAILTEMNTFFSSYYVKTKRFFLCKPPPTAWTGAAPGEWASWSNQVTTLGTVTRADCTVVQMADGPWTDATFLHAETGSNTPAAETGHMANGIALANAIFAAT